MTTCCPRCGATWGGVVACHCSGCHRTFSSVTYFDKHRWHRGERDGCTDPATLSVRGQPLVNRNGIWGGPDMTDEAKAARRKS